MRQISRYICSAQEFVEWGSQYHLYEAYQHATYTVMIHTYFLHQMLRKPSQHNT
jgi:hypothetical protein